MWKLEVVYTELQSWCALTAGVKTQADMFIRKPVVVNRKTDDKSRRNQYINWGLILERHGN